MTKLKILHACGTCGITDEGIKQLNLRELNAYNNSRITDVNHMTKLEILGAGGCCGITDEGIKQLNLRELYVGWNSKITNLNHKNSAFSALTSFGEQSSLF